MQPQPLTHPHVLSVTRTLRLKVKTEGDAWLNAAALEVNQVWNWAAQVSEKAARPCTGEPKWLTGFDLNNLSSGASEHFEKIGADTIQRVNGEYAEKRRITQRYRLRWRTSRGPRRSLGWVPFKAASLKRKGQAVRFCGKTFRVFESERLEGTRASVRHCAPVDHGEARPLCRSLNRIKSRLVSAGAFGLAGSKHPRGAGQCAGRAVCDGAQRGICLAMSPARAFLQSAGLRVELA